MSYRKALPSCERCTSPLEIGDIRCAVCSLPAPVTSDAPSEATASILRCDECGAAVTYSAEHVGTRCPFCSAVTHLEQPADPIEAAEGYLPFAVDPLQAAAALRSWMSKLGFFRPSDLSGSATVAEVKPLFFAAWVFDADAMVSWAADSNAGSRRSDWAPHSGQTPMRFERVLVSASRGLLSSEVAKLTSSFQLSNIQANPNSGDDAVVERFDVQRSAARAIISNAVDETARARVAASHVPGTRVRNCKVSVLVEGLQSRRYGFPVYVFVYRYRDKPFRAIVHGQDVRVVFGEAPISVRKIAMVAAAALLVVSVILAIATYGH